MAKNGRNSKRVNRIGSLPKGLPIRATTATRKSLDGTSTNRQKRGRSVDAAAPSTTSSSSNPFEGKANKRLKHEVLNRSVSGSRRNASSITLAKAFQMRQQRASDILSLGTAKMGNNGTSGTSFKDHRIGAAGISSQQYLSKDEAMLRRLVKERVLRSKRASKFDFTNDNNTDDPQQQLVLTHRGQTIDESYFDTTNEASDDEDEFYEATLSRADTELHFGGPASSTTKRSNNNNKSINPYGPATAAAADVTMADIHRSRKSELEEIIARSKLLKAEKARQKDEQVNTFETMDEHFSELAKLLAWNHHQKKDELLHSSNKISSIGNDSEILLLQQQQPIIDDGHRREERTEHIYDESKEMDEWNKQVKEFLFTRKVMATDRTKTPEEIATEEAERLQKLERRRLARMNGDFDADDDLSDIDITSSEEEDDDHDDDKHGGGSKIVKIASQRGKSSNRKKTKTTKIKQGIQRNPDELDDDVNDDPKKSLQARFTADGLIYIDKDGKVITEKGSVLQNLDDILEEEEEDNEDVLETSTHSTEEESASENLLSSNSEESYDGLGNTDDEASAAPTDEASEDNDDDDELKDNRNFDILLDAFHEKRLTNKAQENDVTKKLKKKQLKAELQAR
jgi:nucleolar protein 14